MALDLQAVERNAFHRWSLVHDLIPMYARLYQKKSLEIDACNMISVLLPCYLIFSFLPHWYLATNDFILFLFPLFSNYITLRIKILTRNIKKNNAL